jgi:hypothetical protein
MGTVAGKRVTDTDHIADPAHQLAEARAALDRAADELDRTYDEFARTRQIVRRLERGEQVPSDANDSGDVLVSCKEGAAEVNSTPQTVWRWQDKYPDALGAKRVGGKVFVSLRKLKFFARRRPI